MKLAEKTDVVSCAGCIRIELRSGDDWTATVLSPRAARMLAKNLEALAADAEAWEGEGVHDRWQPPSRPVEEAAPPPRKRKRRDPVVDAKDGIPS